MDQIPNSAIVIAIGLLVIIWGFFFHMIMSQAPDAHLQFLLDLTRDLEEQPKSSPPRGSSPCQPYDGGMVTPHVTVQSPRGEGQQHSAQHVWQEVPLLLATSLRGRGL
jgi:hypothetical protein